jgi:hypothetical protein
MIHPIPPHPGAIYLSISPSTTIDASMAKSKSRVFLRSISPKWSAYMPLNTAAAYGIYSDDVAIADIVHTLNQAGFENEDICMMLSPTHPIASVVREASVFNNEKDDSAATAGMIGWLSAFGAVLIPTVGFFIRSQAFLHALMASRGTPALCGNANTLVGLGFSENDAERFEDQVRRIGVLVYVSCSENEKLLWAQEVLKHTGAVESATLHEGLQPKILMAQASA